MHTPSSYRRLHRFGVSSRNARATAAGCLAAFLTACATVPSAVETPDVFAPATTRTVTWETARRNLARVLLRADHIVSYSGPVGLFSASPRYVSVTPAYVAFQSTERRVLRFTAGELLIAKAVGGWSAGILTSSGGSPQPHAKENYLHFIFRDRADAEAFLQAWHDARLAARSAGDGDSNFAQRAAVWRLRTPTPPLSESANRHRVLAEEATRARDYARAIEEFEAALETDPMWRSGNFNLALLYETVEEWDEAVRYMRRFLLLEPDSREASAARDKIIQWEDRARRALR